MSDTPRTDACWDDESCNILMHSRQLERELAEVNTVSATLLTTKCRELAEITKQRDLLLEGLEKLATCDWVITLPDRMDAVREIARQTLQIVKNNKL